MSDRKDSLKAFSPYRNHLISLQNMKQTYPTFTTKNQKLNFILKKATCTGLT